MKVISVKYQPHPETMLLAKAAHLDHLWSFKTSLLPQTSYSKSLSVRSSHEVLFVSLFLSFQMIPMTIQS